MPSIESRSYALCAGLFLVGLLAGPSHAQEARLVAVHRSVQAALPSLHRIEVDRRAAELGRAAVDAPASLDETVGDATPIPGEWSEESSAGDWDSDEDWDLEDEYADAAAEQAGGDRYESVNRAMFSVNRVLDRAFFDPFTYAYRFAVPKLARRAIHNAFLNLDSPVVLVNALLQGETEMAGDTLGRLVLNSTVGLGGLIDVAAMQGAPRPQTDFGETLATWGVGSGPYLVVPLFGPTTVRDGVGRGIDVLFQPLTYVLGPLPGALISTGKDLTRREQVFDGLRALEASSIDHYAALRSAYLQDREAQLRERQPSANAAPTAGPAPTAQTEPRLRTTAESNCVSPRMRAHRRPHVRSRARCAGSS